MKCKILRPLAGRSPEDPSVQQNVVFPQSPEVNRHGTWIWPAGTTIEHPESYRLVQQGVAIPVDDECKVAHLRSNKQLAAAQVAYERVSRGILPEDYEKFDAGIIAGYDGQGGYIPGPNAATFDDLEDDLEEDEDDE